MKLWLIIHRSRSRFIFEGSEPEPKPEPPKIGRLRNSGKKWYFYFNQLLWMTFCYLKRLYWNKYNDYER